MFPVRIPTWIAGLVLFGVLAATRLHADESRPLHQTIEDCIQSRRVISTSTPAADHEFLRRIYLDLMGRTPNAKEARQFLEDTAADKKTKLMDTLLQSDECNKNLAIAFDLMLMERRIDKYIPRAEWRNYLQNSFKNNKPLDQLAREILAADGATAGLRPAAKFYLDREVETHSVTQDISRVFLGRDIECAQCHDHPLYSDYLQAEYYGLYSFLNRSYRFEDPKDKKSYLGEKAEGDTEYSSVFEPDMDKVLAIAQLANGSAFENEPLLLGDDAYRVKPAKNVRPIPIHSRREFLASLIARDTNQVFTRNLANRLWAHMMGRGLVHPVDLHHSENPPTNPALLDALSEGLVALKFDTKSFLKEIALSHPYQQSIDMPSQDLGDSEQLAARTADLRQQQSKLNSKYKISEDELNSALGKLDVFRETASQTSKSITDIDKKRTEIQGQMKKETTAKAAGAGQVAAKNKVIEQLKNSLTQTDAALKQLPKDKELLKTKQQLAERIKVLEPQAKQLHDQQQQHDAKLADFQNQLEQLSKHRHQLETDRSVQLTETTEARGVVRYLQQIVDQQFDEISAIDHQLAYLEMIEKSLQMRATAVELDTQLKTLTLQFEKDSLSAKTISSQIQPLTEHYHQSQNAESESARKIAAMETERTAQAGLVATLIQAHEKTTEAINLLEKDEQLAAAAATISQKVQSSQAALQEIENNLSQLKATQVAQQKSIRELKQKISEFHAAKSAAEETAEQTKSQLEETTAKLERIHPKINLQQKAIEQEQAKRFEFKWLKPLSPEQMAGSTIAALGLQDRYMAEATSEWKSKNKDKKEADIDPQKREAEIRDLYKKRTNGIESTFVRLFAAAPASPQDVFFASVDQALFLANDGNMNNWLSPSNGSLTHRLMQLKEDEIITQELYLSILSRFPDKEELADSHEYLKTAKDKQAAIKQLAWALHTSLEFRFNH